MEGTLSEAIVHLENILDGRSEPTELPISLLNYMTRNFSEEREIGRGGFGVVFKGELKNRYVAVKKLTFSNNTEKDFDREISNLMMVKHENIVQFLGYCNHTKSTLVNTANSERRSFVYTQQRILCFEYISKGSLTDHIHDELRGLEWHIRYNIIKEICHGLEYLHNEKKIVHRDLKPDNILVDNFMVPKIADLGISKHLNDGKSKAMTTNANMSMEYAPPEFGQRVVSFKYDIYSLGVIIIELITGVREKPNVKNVLTRWRHRWNKSNETRRYQQVAKCMEIAILCIKKNLMKRPSISSIINDLNDMDGANGHIINPSPSESAVGKVIPIWNELWIEPPELFFPFQINKEISCLLELHNETDAHLAFLIITYSEFQYRVQPKKGIVPPSSKFTVNITLLAEDEEPYEMRNDDKFIVKSTRVNEDLTSEDIIEDVFSKRSGNIVDKTRLRVVFDAKLRAPCMVEEEPKKHMSLELLEIEANQETGETSVKVKSSKHSLDGQDKSEEMGETSCEVGSSTHSLESLEIEANQGTGETSAKVESSTHSMGGHDKSEEMGETSFEVGSSTHSLVLHNKHGGMSNGLPKKAPLESQSSDVIKSGLSSWIPFLPLAHVFDFRSKKRSGYVRRFAYRELEKATRNFAEELGTGAFGTVYKGEVMLRDREMAVAIKKHKLATASKEAMAAARSAFDYEIDMMSPLNHRNIIRLIGWCDERHSLLLVYELVENQNLETHLYDIGASVDAELYRGAGLALDWHKRRHILLGIATGLDYLHHECEKSVLHRDIKPANVMLDRNFNAKLCDFGLVTQLTHAAITSRLTDTVIGSPGYMDPLFLRNNMITRDSDVYSFGVLLLEVICGNKPIMTANARNSLVEHVRECGQRNAILNAAHPQLKGDFNEEIEGALLIGLRCVEPNRGDRPTIQVVLAELVSLTTKPTPHNRHATPVYDEV